MSRCNRDVYIAVALLILWGAFFGSTFYVEDMGYQSLGSEVWPRFILAVLLALLLGYLFQSLRRGGGPAAGGSSGLAGWFRRYQNALAIYALFFLFLVTLPWLGMLLGGILFVFLTLTALGERTPRAHVIHAVIAIGTIGGMWALFTFGLHVLLPEGVILRI